MTSIQPLRQINQRVWQVTYQGRLYMMKYYPNQATLQKVVAISRQLKAMNFPHSIDVKKVLFDGYLLQPWMPNRQVIHYGDQKNRTDTLRVLAKLHQYGKGIDHSSIPAIQPYSLLKKWSHRLWRFQQLKSVCQAYLTEEQYELIERYALDAMALFRQTDFSEEVPTILHGDVVHHNFLRTETDELVLIDFDLATTGPESIELILWLHRVLPQVSYNLGKLIDEQPILTRLQAKHYRYLLYPNELLREWLYFFSLDEAEKQKKHAKILAFTTSALSHWPNLWYNVLQINN